MFLAEKKDRVN
jgi:hypothetical protein